MESCSGQAGKTERTFSRTGTEVIILTDGYDSAKNIQKCSKHHGTTEVRGIKYQLLLDIYIINIRLMFFTSLVCFTACGDLVIPVPAGAEGNPKKNPLCKLEY